MRSEYLSFSPPLIDEEEISAVVEALRSGWISSGPRVKEFESEFARCFHSRSAVAVSSCTAALHASLHTLGIGPGDEVIVPAWTFCATANVVEHTGARPVVVDIEPQTLNIDPQAVEAAITPATRAIIPVHFAGHPAPMDEINSIARRHHLTVLEDAAHAVGASYRGQAIGSGANPTAFSFYATKNLATGEGGMLTGDPAFVEKVRGVALHGMTKAAWNRYGKTGDWRYDVVTPGFKYNMTDLQAALGIAQLARFDAMQQTRRRVANYYTQRLSGVAAYELPTTLDGVEHAWHLYVLRLRQDTLTINRDRLFEELRQRNIGASVHFIPIPSLSHYQKKHGLRLEDFPIAAANADRVISLPLHGGMTLQDAADVVDALCDITEEFAPHRMAA
jgi:dTDP-4-amino-4,6-dideoxygalactose transaminase